LKPGERKVISDGSAGPIIEIIRKTGDDAGDYQTSDEEFGPANEVDADTTGE
jgi:small subunit ribosomal protein S2